MTVIHRKTKLKARRLIRTQKRQITSVSEQADEGINKHFLKRFSRLFAVRRFVFVWVLLLFVLGGGTLWQVQGLDKFYLESRPADGGTYREGIIGAYTNGNPIFAAGSVDTSIAKLVFSSLFVTRQGILQGDLAEKYTVDESGKNYLVNLKQGVFWHDGEVLNADDVVFTYKTIQNPAARSILESSWQGVNITKIDDYTVNFELPNALSSFPYSMTNGIVPEHVLGLIEPAELRSDNFNTIGLIGSGPFKLTTVEVEGESLESRQERIVLARHDKYHNGVTAVNGAVIRSYRDEDTMLTDFDNQIIQSMVGLSTVPSKLLDSPNAKAISIPLTSKVMIFMNNSNEILKDKEVRRALVMATNVEQIRSRLSFMPTSSNSPFLRSQFAYDTEVTQLDYNVASAKESLDKAGWVPGTNGIREKEGKKLKVRLLSQSLSEYSNIVQQLQVLWGEVGVEVEAVLQPEEDLQSGALAGHDYDVLLYGISIGHDPDIFAYWHSSQIDPNSQSRLNLSEFNNPIADAALEAGRTRADESLRKVKYRPFLEVWRDEAPGISLYQPNFLMIVQGVFDGIETSQMLNATERFNSVSNWRVRNDKVYIEN